MPLFEIVIIIAVFITWPMIFIIYHRKKIIPWLSNKFIPDKPIKQDVIKDGFFSDGTPIPFRDNLYPPNKENIQTSPQPEDKKNEG